MSSSTNTKYKPGEILNKINQIKDYLDDYILIMNYLDDPLGRSGKDRLDLLELENDFAQAYQDLKNWTRDRYNIDSRWQLIGTMFHKE